MNALKFKRIIYIIAVTALITIATQVYRNVQNYQQNKQQFVNDVQLVLDQSIESYFADLAKQDIMIYSGAISEEDTLDFRPARAVAGAWSTADSAVVSDGGVFRFITDFNQPDSVRHFLRGQTSLDSVFAYVDAHTISKIDVSKRISGDSLESQVFSNEIKLSFTDSVDRIKGFAKQLIVSMSNNALDFKRLDSYVVNELKRKNLEVDHLLVVYRYTPHRFESLDLQKNTDNTRTVSFRTAAPDTILSDPGADMSSYPLEVFSKSTYLSKSQRLGIKFENASLNILKRGGVDMFISLLITTVVIGSLMYLYGIISEQKQLAEIKNDLISNITHEFKTPIATISTAMEGISNFNQMNDPEKTAKYVGISQDQLKKLNGMVEKLLETASLDSNELEIAMEEVEVVSFTRQIFERFHLLKGDKQLSFQTDLVEEWLEFDPFHMENAIGNLIDNAIKYGGDKVLLKLSKVKDQVVWEVQDNGGKINKLEQQRIFDKFYRIPTGNVHNVKGFGIGLYYTKTLVEKHNGHINLAVSPNSTIFTIELNNVKA